MKKRRLNNGVFGKSESIELQTYFESALTYSQQQDERIKTTTSKNNNKLYE